VAPPATPPAPKAAARVIPLAHAPLPYARPRIEEPAPVESRRRAGKNTESDHVADEPAEPAVGPTGAPPLVPLEASNFSRTPEKPTAPLEPAGGKCPKCESTAVFHSRARSRLERLLERWQIPICRCHRCYHRYLVFARLKIAKEMPVGTERRFKPRRRR
jgi:DNA-directed RNA polymerase subunit M/transcription elongation factor TFIIS